FGSLRNAYALIGYVGTRNFDHFDSRQRWADVLAQFISYAKTHLGATNECVESNSLKNSLHVGQSVVVFRVARWFKDEKRETPPVWTIQRGAHSRLPSGWIVAIRLAEKNKSILDYTLMAISGAEKEQIRFSERMADRRDIKRFVTPASLVRSLSRLL